jgi:hypothetical protein
MRKPNAHPNPSDEKRYVPNPSDDYPPTRPGALVVVVALLLIVAGLGIENWPDISRQVPRIETAFGL